ncbi:NAD dependent epimerase/dehydratase family protein-like protein [Dendryphion nanum]|uniref:NAD dependent epimerase/dehydratase family protein-like protein n=1 Tax=Dendryphion nanum TaxID=256645 RepID=A0A9P9DIK0_9PLEO|nr:NAD dependent epimerase/dehydratase family protein-like protein [Dendryphion nanum]
MSTTAALAGSTGLVGSHILSQLLAHPSISSLHAYTRRKLPNATASTKLNPLSSTDTSTWASLFPTSPAPKIFLSALGTTRGQAGSVEAQRKVDLDLNYALATAAKAAGVETYVLISSMGSNSASRMPYAQMKGELEDKVKALKFKNTVILRPGVIVGSREDSRPAEAALRHLAWGLRKVAGGALVDFWAQDAEVIARAAVEAGLAASEGKGKGDKDGVWLLMQKDVVEWGKQK